MAHKQWTQSHAGSTLGEFQTWGQSFSTAFTDVGLTPVTALTPIGGGATTLWGSLLSRPAGIPQAYYAVYALPTAMIPASPVYLKVFYGTKSATQHSISFAVGTNPAVTGVIAALPGTSSYNANMSGDQNYLACDGHGLMLHCGNTASASVTQLSFFFVLDRHRTSDGDVLGTGTAAYSGWQHAVGGTNLVVAQFDHVAGTVRNPVTNTAPCISPGFSTSPRLDATGRTQICPWWGVTANSRGLSKMLGTYNYANHPSTVTAIDVDFCGNFGEPYLAMGASMRSGLSTQPLSAPQADDASLALWWGA